MKEKELNSLFNYRLITVYKNEIKFLITEPISKNEFTYKLFIHHQSIIFLCFALTLSDSTYSQLNSGNFTQYTEKEGLPGVQVNDVLIDRLGYVWTGTVNGLARYDGYSFNRFYFNPNDTNTNRGLIVNSMFEDRKGQIWVGNSRVT
jgi:hypothetical protein